MKTKNFFSNLFNRGVFFKSTAAADNEKQSKPLRQNADWGQSDKNMLLQRIYWAAGHYEFENLETHIRKYLVEYGSLSGNEIVWFRERMGDIYDGYYEWVSETLLFLATDFTKKFFFALVSGDAATAKEYRRKAELQSALKKAFEEKDVVAFDKLLSAGADINYAYYYPYGDHKITLWEKVNGTKGRMFEYFMTRMDVPQVKKLVEQKKAEEELITARRMQIA